MTTVGQALDSAVRALDGGLQAPVGSLGEPAAAGPLPAAVSPLLAALHDAAMRATGDETTGGANILAAAARAVRERVPAGAEAGLDVRPRIFVRLLRVGALEPAWTLASDNASGVVLPARAVVMWAGGSQLTNALSVPTLTEGGRMYAWLPGFRDPRWAVPDDVYDITGGLSACVRLHQLSPVRGRLLLAGIGYLNDATARADDDIAVVLTGPGGDEHLTRAVRTRTPDRVEPAGPEHTRLAWAGWHADVDLTRLAHSPGTWRCRLTVAQGGVRRAADLGVRRGPFAELVGRSGPQEAAGRVFRIGRGADGQVLVTVAALGSPARYIPRPVRAALRRVVPRR